jgi:TonB family protein
VSLKYDDFDLEITPSGDNYRVHLNGPTGQAAADFILPFTDVDVSNFLGRIGQVRRSMRRADAPELHAAKDFGGKLFKAIFAGELIAQLRSSVEQSLNNDRGLRIRLRLTDSPELADLPWEFLYDSAQNHFLTTSTETPLVRFLDLPQRIAPLRATLPLRVLVVISSPKNLKRLDAEGEWQRLQDALADLLRGGHIVLERLPAATIDALRLRARGAPFHIFHFIGHGGFDIIAEDGVLQFEDENGMSHPVRGEMLGMHLHDHRSLRLAVLNACEGARSSRQDPFSGVAQSLLQQRVPAVIAMQFEISDAAAKVFAREFYCAIAEGNPVDAAVCESRKALFNEEFGQEWATPVLYMRSHEGQLFDLQAPTVSAPDTKSGEHERAEAERDAAELAETERIAVAEKERQAREKTEQARMAGEKAETQRRAAEKAETERLAAAEAQRLAAEKAEREHLASEKREAERRAREKAEADRAATAENERQVRENAEAEHSRGQQATRKDLAQAMSASETRSGSQVLPPPTPTVTIPSPAPGRPHLPLWQILLVSVPVAALVLALSWHHLRPHDEGTHSPAAPSVVSQNPELRSEPAAPKEETPAVQKNPGVAPDEHGAGAAARAKRTDETPATQPSNANKKEPTSENRPATPMPVAKTPLASPARLRVSATAQAAKIVNHVSPTYPALAAQGHITGAVELRVVIAKDGTVQNVSLISGNPLLAQSATDAVKQWRYQPTLVDNQPVEVESTVTVDYTMKTSDPAAQAPVAKSTPCTFGRIDFQEAGTRLVGTVPYTYTGNAQLQTLAILGIPMTADNQQISGVKLGETTLQAPSGTASFSIEGHPSLGRAGTQGESVLVVLAVKSTNEMVCSKLVPYLRIW